MSTYAIPGDPAGCELRFTPAADSTRLVMSVVYPEGQRDSVVLQRSWLRPLAAWLAGEAQPGIVGHDEYGLPHGRWLTIAGDETAVAYGALTWARLECSRPFGTARVTVGRRGLFGGLTVTLSPEARQHTAAWLRRTDARTDLAVR